MSNGLEYSNEALSSKGLFYNKTITVYVEGKDDPLFWDKLFDLAEISAHIEDVGGKEELEKLFNKIIRGIEQSEIPLDVVVKGRNR